MRLRNTTDIPDEYVREVIRFVRPPGISNFDVEVRNSSRGVCGRPTREVELPSYVTTPSAEADGFSGKRDQHPAWRPLAQPEPGLSRGQPWRKRGPDEANNHNRRSANDATGLSF